MSNETSQRLLHLRDKIMKIWEERAIAEVNAAVKHDSLALQDSIPEFIGQIASALSTNIDRTKIRIKWDKDESIRVGKKHGRERASNRNYTMDQLIFEYHILRQVICEVMEEEAALSAIDREIITCAVEQAVNNAATQFSETHHDIREKFSQTLAHDLRGPITTAKLSAQMIIRILDKDKIVKFAQQISASMERLDLMIHDLLDAGKLRAGEHLDLSFEECDLDLILRQTIEESNVLQDKRLIFESKGAMKGQWNENALRRVIDNLITNALKFSTPHSPVTLTLTPGQETIELSVHNMGNPIKQEEQAALFEPFTRARSSEGKVGWGLGLTVVQGVVEAHKGSIELVSSIEKGTIFKITLPLSRDPLSL